MEHVFTHLERELKRKLEEHEKEIARVSYQFAAADTISRAQKALPILKRREAEALLSA